MCGKYVSLGFSGLACLAGALIDGFYPAGPQATPAERFFQWVCYIWLAVAEVSYGLLYMYIVSLDLQEHVSTFATYLGLACLLGFRLVLWGRYKIAVLPVGGVEPAEEAETGPWLVCSLFGYTKKVWGEGPIAALLASLGWDPQ